MNPSTCAHSDIISPTQKIGGSLVISKQPVPVQALLIWVVGIPVRLWRHVVRPENKALEMLYCSLWEHANTLF